MAGRGIAPENEPFKNPYNRIKLLKNGRWQRAFRPFNPDRATAGVCLAESFAALYCEGHAECEVGIIPCADGGTSIEQWKKGEALFDNAVNCARLAMRSSTLVAILWHQGESDCKPDRYPFYLERVREVLREMRKALSAEEVPIVVGTLGDFVKDCEHFPELVNYPYINAALAELAKTEPRLALASAEGLTSNPDNLHFNAHSLLEFGKRYYEAFLTVENPELTYESGAEDGKRSEMELL